jgi:hypothetical protein
MTCPICRGHWFVKKTTGLTVREMGERCLGSSIFEPCACGGGVVYRMLTMHECPKCGRPMEHEEDDPSVGVTGGWYCAACDHAELDDIDDEPDLLRS